MGMIFINRNRQNLGQFTEQEVANGLKNGKFLPDDLAWREPMDSWQPLSTFIDLPVAVENAAELPQSSSIPNLPPTLIQPAWERLQPGHTWEAMIETVKQVFTQPFETFRNMPPEGGYAKPLKFYVLIGWVTGAMAIIYQAAASLINPAMFIGEQAKDLPSPVLILLFGGCILILPILLILGGFISAGLMHFALMLVGGAKKPFETTFRIVTYASGATSVLQLIPLCGGYLYPLANIVYWVIGLKEAHQTDLWRPIVAILILFLFCCGMAVGFLALGFGLYGISK